MDIFYGWKIRYQALLLMVLLVLPPALLSVYVNYHIHKTDAIRDIDNRLYNAATFAKAVLSKTYHDKITDRNSVREKKFVNIVDRHNQLCEELGLEYLWSLMLVDGRPVFTSSTSPDKKVETGLHAKFFEPHANPEIYAEAFATMKPQYRFNDDQWGKVRAVLIPHYDSQGRKYLFGASVKMSDIHVLSPLLLRNALLTAAVFLIPGLLISILASKRLTFRISQLAVAAENMATGDYQKEIGIRGSYEINVLAHRLNVMRKAILEQISSLKDALAQLQEFENNVNSSPVMFHKTRLTEGLPADFVSDNISQLGYTPKDITSGKIPWDQIVLPHDYELTRKIIDHAIETGKEEYHLEARVKCADGEIRWMSAWDRILRDDEGTPTHVHGLLVDVTEQKLVRVQMAEIRNIVNASPMFLFRAKLTPDYTTEFISENIALTGYSAEQIMSGEVKWNQIVHPEDMERIDHIVEEALKSGADDYSLESRMIWVSGETHWYKNWNQFLRDEDGNPTHVQGLLVDITGLKEAQGKQNQYLSKLTTTLDQLQQFKDVVNRSPMVVFRWRAADNWPVEFVTENVSQFGYSAKELISGSVSWLGITHPEDIPRLEKEVAAEMVSGHLEFSQEYRLTTKSGEMRWINDWNRIIKNEAGEVTHIQGIILDITEKKISQQREHRHLARMQALTQELILTEERERRQLAVELHDDLGQMLVALNMKISVLHETRDWALINKLMPQVDELMVRLLNSCKTLTWQLSPPSLYEFDVCAGLERLAGEIEKLFGLKVDFSGCEQSSEIDHVLSALLFRCAKELLVNAAKHSGSENATVELHHVSGQIILCVTTAVKDLIRPCWKPRAALMMVLGCSASGSA